jgi:hypothetical protein
MAYYSIMSIWMSHEAAIAVGIRYSLTFYFFFSWLTAWRYQAQRWHHDQDFMTSHSSSKQPIVLQKDYNITSSYMHIRLSNDTRLTSVELSWLSSEMINIVHVALFAQDSESSACFLGRLMCSVEKSRKESFDLPTCQNRMSWPCTQISLDNPLFRVIERPWRSRRCPTFTSYFPRLRLR